MTLVILAVALLLCGIAGWLFALCRSQRRKLAIKMQSQNGGLHLLRKGYSWWFKTSNNCSLFEYTYKSGEYDKKANAHDVSHREVKQEVIKSKITVNCENDYTNEGWVNEDFFGDKQPRFIFRFATGK